MTETITPYAGKPIDPARLVDVPRLESGFKPPMRSLGFVAAGPLSANPTGAGYTDVKIMPDAFMVAATNKSGEKVVMFPAPDSLSMFTAVDAKGQEPRTIPAAPPPGSYGEIS